MIPAVFQVAAGGAIGAAMRYGVGIWLGRVAGHGFPYGTVTVNIGGSFVMGAFVIIAANRGLTHLAPFAMVGLLGGFTTFSSFSLDAVTLFERGEAGTAALYVAVSVFVSIAALMAGMWIFRQLLS